MRIPLVARHIKTDLCCKMLLEVKKTNLKNLAQKLQKFFRPALVAQSDACSTGNQEIAGSIPTGSGNIVSRRMIME